MNHDYVIFVLPTPWRWLSVAVFVFCLGVNLWLLWRQNQTRRRIAHLAAPLVDICRRHGFADEAEQIQADIDRLQRGLGLSWRRADRRKVDA